jgi:hypothetical protein
LGPDVVRSDMRNIPCILVFATACSTDVTQAPQDVGTAAMDVGTAATDANAAGSMDARPTTDSGAVGAMDARPMMDTGTTGAMDARPTMDANAVDAGTTALSFAADIFPIFVAASCNSSQCHDSSRPSGGLDMSDAQTTYANMVGVRTRSRNRSRCGGDGTLVAANDSSRSMLFLKLGSNPPRDCGTRMPRGTNAMPLSPAEVEAVQVWIDTGAAP